MLGPSSHKDTIHTVPSHFLNSVTHLPPINDKDNTSMLKNNSMKIDVYGRRIVNIKHLLQEIRNIDCHKPFDCGFNNMILIGKKKFGFKSVSNIKCSMCDIKKSMSTESEDFMVINTLAVVGVMNIGRGFSNLQEIMSAMELTTINQKTYKKKHDWICNGYEKAAIKSMNKAAKAKAELAIKAGEIDVDGMPLITVAADCSWCKRSSKTLYNSPSGTVTMLVHTFFILYLKPCLQVF